MRGGSGLGLWAGARGPQACDALPLPAARGLGVHEPERPWAGRLAALGAMVQGGSLVEASNSCPCAPGGAWALRGSRDGLCLGMGPGLRHAPWCLWAGGHSRRLQVDRGIDGSAGPGDGEPPGTGAGTGLASHRAGVWLVPAMGTRGRAVPGLPCAAAGPLCQQSAVLQGGRKSRRGQRPGPRASAG